MIYIAATGHRPDRLGGYNSELHRRLVVLATEVIGEALCQEREPVTFISGMAPGWDQAVFEAILKLGGGPQNKSLGILAAVPFIGQELRWPDAAQQHYRYLLERASEAHVVTPGKLTGGEVFGAFHARNRWMVDRAKRVIALWNGSQGGTSHCVRYAQQQGVPVLNVWNRWQAMVETMDATLKDRKPPVVRKGL